MAGRNSTPGKAPTPWTELYHPRRQEMPVWEKRARGRPVRWGLVGPGGRALHGCGQWQKGTV
ncbi:hypothetical protein N657DRAFT_651300, partial [Parathielavia appendiculata]